MYRQFIHIDRGRIKYELNNHGQAVVIVPSSVTQQEIDDAMTDLRKTYKEVNIDCDGDIVISES